MKKKISLLGLVLILVLGFTGCSKSDEAVEYDQAALEQTADYMIQLFSSMPDENAEQFKKLSEMELDLTLIQSGLPVSGENFLTMMDAWKTGVDECGTFVDRDEYEMETTNDGVTLTAEAEFEERDGSIEFAFDENMKMETITVAAHYSMGEILEKAALNTVLGMGTVFVVLIFISFIISLFKYIPAIEKKFGNSRKAEQPVAAPAPAVVQDTVEETDDTELAAVIAAAVAASEGTSPDGFIVRSIRRRKSNKWN